MGTMCVCIDRKGYAVEPPLGSIGRVQPKRSLFHLEVHELPDADGNRKAVCLKELMH